MKQLIFLMLLLSSVWAVPQGSVKGDAVLNNLGSPIPFPSVRVGTATATTGGNPNSPITPLDNVYTDATLTSIAANPFAGDSNGNFQFFAAPGYHVLQICASGVNCYTTTILMAADPNNFGTMFGAAVVSNCGNQSSTCTPALTGALRLGPSDGVCWRNTANTADVCITKNGSDQLVGTTNAQTSATSLTSASANPAGSGVIRLATGDTACWRNAANTADICFTHDANDRINVNGAGFQSPQYQTSSATPALSGVVRLSANDAACWRNTANTADVCITQSAGALNGISGSATSVTSASANPAATGVVRLAAGDTACWRNAGNTADICLSKDANDRITAPSFSTASFVSTTANIAGSGQIRLASGDTFCFRNNANSADICLSKNTSDQLNATAFAQLLALVFTSNTANPAASGVVRLAASDTFCFRNAGNTADICVSKNGSDAIAVPTLNVGGTLTVTGPETFSADSITGQTKTTRFSWTCQASNTGGGVNVPVTPVEILCQMKAPVALTARQLDFWQFSPTTTCTTSPTYSITDVTTASNLISATGVNGQQFVSATGTGNVNLGDLVAIKITTAGVGCTIGFGGNWYAWFTTN